MFLICPAIASRTSDFRTSSSSKNSSTTARVGSSSPLSHLPEWPSPMIRLEFSSWPRRVMKMLFPAIEPIGRSSAKQSCHCSSGSSVIFSPRLCVKNISGLLSHFFAPLSVGEHSVYYNNMLYILCQIPSKSLYFITILQFFC